jgi:hypothetical protein
MTAPPAHHHPTGPLPAGRVHGGTGPFALATRGWPVFPIRLTVEQDGRVAKTPTIRGAHPAGHGCHGQCGRLGHGHWDATTDPDLIAAWTRAYPWCQWGIATGPAGLVVIDLDAGKGTPPDRVLPDQAETEPTPAGIVDGADVMCWAAERSHGRWPVDTYTVTTVSGGQHAYFTAPTGVVITSGAGLTSGLGWCVDVRAHGGWVVAPGATCPAGTWTVDDPTVPVVPLPAWILLRLAAVGRVADLGPLAPQPAPPPTRPGRPALSGGLHGRPYVTAALARELDTAATAGQGQRNVTLNRAAFNVGTLMDAAGLDLRAVADALLDAATAAGLPEAEAKHAIRNGLAAGRRNPRRAGGAA